MAATAAEAPPPPAAPPPLRSSPAAGLFVAFLNHARARAFDAAASGLRNGLRQWEADAEPTAAPALPAGKAAASLAPPQPSQKLLLQRLVLWAERGGKAAAYGGGNGGAFELFINHGGNVGLYEAAAAALAPAYAQAAAVAAARKDGQGWSLLDVGTGSGGGVVPALQRCGRDARPARVDLVDPTAEMLRVAAARVAPLIASREDGEDEDGEGLARRLRTHNLSLQEFRAQHQRQQEGGGGDIQPQTPQQEQLEQADQEEQQQAPAPVEIPAPDRSGPGAAARETSLTRTIWPWQWDVCQSTFALHNLGPTERAACLRWLAERCGTLLLVEFDVPAVLLRRRRGGGASGAAEAERARAAATLDAYTRGVAEYLPPALPEEDCLRVLDGFLVPILLASFAAAPPAQAGEATGEAAGDGHGHKSATGADGANDSTAIEVAGDAVVAADGVTTTFEQAAAEWEAELTAAGFATVRTQRIFQYWWAPAVLVTATRD